MVNLTAFLEPLAQLSTQKRLDIEYHGDLHDGDPNPSAHTQRAGINYEGMVFGDAGGVSEVRASSPVFAGTMI